MISRKDSSVKSSKPSEERIFHELNDLEEISGVYQRYDVENDDVILTLTSSLYIRVPRTTLKILRSLTSGTRVRILRVDNRIMIHRL